MCALDRLAPCLAAMLTGIPALAFAHHSFAMFDMTKDQTVTGTVVQFQWESPHSWLDLTSTDKDRAHIRWSFEMGAPNALYRRGWRQSSLKPGDQVTVVLHPLRDGRNGGSLVSVTLPDGKQLQGSGGSAAPASPQRAVP